MTTAVTAGVAFAVTVALMPLVQRLAILAGATDLPDPRRIHVRPTPRGGGLGVAAGAAIALALSAGTIPVRPCILAGFLLVLLTGLVDDLVSVRPLVKLLVQVLAGVLVVAEGLRLALFGSVPGPALAVLDATLTVFWVVLVTNAFNLSDGLDGLTTGLGVIALGWLAMAAAGVSPEPAALAIVLAAALLGFLPFNFNPARLFLGDTGSLTVGYVLACLPLSGPAGAGLAPLAIFLLAAVPVTDTLLAFARRFVSGCLPLWGKGSFWRGIAQGFRSTVQPDRRHVHHRLLDLGFTQRRAVLTLYGAAATTGSLAYLVTASPGWPADLFALGLGCGVIALVRTLGIDELRPARSGLLLPVLRRIGRRQAVVIVADLSVVASAFGGALWLTGQRDGGVARTVGAVAMMVAGQLVIFAVSRMYRTAWATIEVRAVAAVLRAVGLGTMMGYVILRLTGMPAALPAAIVYGGLLLSAVTLVRFARPLLAAAARPSLALTLQPTLIVGTAAAAQHALGRLRQNGLGHLDPVGFVDLRGRAHARGLEQVPVLGPLEALPDIVRRNGIRHLVIADARLTGPSVDWVRAVCRRLDVTIQHYVERLVPDEELSRPRRGAPRTAVRFSAKTLGAPESLPQPTAAPTSQLRAPLR